MVRITLLASPAVLFLHVFLCLIALVSLKYTTERVYVIFTEWHILLSFSIYHLKKHICTSNKKKYLSFDFSE